MEWLRVAIPKEKSEPAIPKKNKQNTPTLQHHRSNTMVTPTAKATAVKGTTAAATRSATKRGKGENAAVPAKRKKRTCPAKPPATVVTRQRDAPTKDDDGGNKDPLATSDQEEEKLETDTQDTVITKSTITESLTTSKMKVIELQLAKQRLENKRLIKLVEKMENSRGGTRGARIPKKLKSSSIVVLEEEVFAYVSKRVYPRYKFLLQGWDIFDSSLPHSLSNHAFKHLNEYYPKDKITGGPENRREFWEKTMVPIISLKMITRKNSCLQAMRKTFNCKWA